MRDRFVVRELVGYSSSVGSHGGASPGLTVTVLNSAYCYTVLLRLRTEDRKTGGPGYGSRRSTKESNAADIRREAEAYCAAMNAKYA